MKTIADIVVVLSSIAAAAVANTLQCNATFFNGAGTELQPNADLDNPRCFTIPKATSVEFSQNGSTLQFGEPYCLTGYSEAGCVGTAVTQQFDEKSVEADNEGPRLLPYPLIKGVAGAGSYDWKKGKCPTAPQSLTSTTLMLSKYSARDATAIAPTSLLPYSLSYSSGSNGLSTTKSNVRRSDPENGNGNGNDPGNQAGNNAGNSDDNGNGNGDGDTEAPPQLPPRPGNAGGSGDNGGDNGYPQRPPMTYPGSTGGQEANSPNTGPPPPSGYTQQGQRDPDYQQPQRQGRTGNVPQAGGSGWCWWPCGGASSLNLDCGMPDCGGCSCSC